MSLALDFSLRLEGCGADRVLVSALLAPTEGSVRLDGVALQVVSREGEPLGVRMLLPIAGELNHPMLSTVQLKCEDLPRGARVVGTAWRGTEAHEAVLPTEPFTHLQEHVQARKRIVGFAAETDLDVLEGDERRTLVAHFPWIDEPRVPVAVGELEVMDEEDDGVDAAIDGMGLDPENAEWLKDLLSEE